MPAVRIEVAAGHFEFRVYDDLAPHTCQYFLDLISRGALDNGAIFRITTQSNYRPSAEPPIEVVQIGTQLGLDEPRQRIPHEPTNATGILHRRYTVSASRFEPGELYGSFFVCMRDEPALDFGGGRRADGQGYAAFGEVVRGRALLDGIFAAAEENEVLRKAIPIQGIGLTTADSE